MKRLIFLVIIIFLSFPLWSEETGVDNNGYPLDIVIVGATNYGDVDFVLKNLKRSSLVSQLILSTSSKGFVQFHGSYYGSRDAVVEEVGNLVQDRFSQEILKSGHKKSSDNLSITLRKLPPPTLNQ